MGETLTTLKMRRSCRSYKPERIEGEYEGIGHLILGYPANPAGEAAPRKADYVYKI